MNKVTDKSNEKACDAYYFFEVHIKEHENSNPTKKASEQATKICFAMDFCITTFHQFLRQQQRLLRTFPWLNLSIIHQQK